MKGFIIYTDIIYYQETISYDGAVAQHFMRQTVFIILWFVFFIGANVGR